MDDIDYRITHVARGEDLLSSTPKHILLTEALGAEWPVYAHLPLLFGTDRRKLSKRHGDTALRAYREGGYLAPAVFNYMSLLGWSLGSDDEIFGREEAAAAFDLTAVQKSPAVFDAEKLAWMNGVYMRAMAGGEFVRPGRRLYRAGPRARLGRGRAPPFGRSGAPGAGAGQADHRGGSGGPFPVHRRLLRRAGLAQGHERGCGPGAGGGA